MELAASLYNGGQLISAQEGDYSTSRELGLICPFCKESVFLLTDWKEAIEVLNDKTRAIGFG